MASEGQTPRDRRTSAVGAGRAVLPRRRTRRVVAVTKKKIVEDEFMAAAIGDVKWLEQSLRDGRSTTAMDKNGLATIHLAALHGRLECLKLLVEKYRVDVDFPSSTGWRAVHLVINRETGKRAHRCLQYLLEQGADPSAMNDDSLTPVHQAASEGLVDCLQLLIDCRGVVDVIDVRGHRPIDLAKLWGHRKCARMLASVMWSQEKEFFAKEMRQLGQVTAKYWDFERDTAETKRAEQDFYGQVAFGNWIDDKGLPPKLKQMDFLSRPEQFPTKPSTTKSKTSTRSAEGTTTGSGLYRPNSKVAAPPPAVSSPKKEAVIRGIHTTTQKFPVREQGLRPPTQPPQEIIEPPMSPSKSPVSPQKDMKVVHTKQWKPFFTNVESEPQTDIFRPHEVRRSVEPEENDPFSGLQRTKSQPITSHVGYDLAEVERPVTSGGLRMPVLPEEVIRRGLSRQRLPHERIKMPQEFKCVNIIDVQQKRLPDPEVRQGEAAMHLAQTLESNLFQLAVRDNRMSTANSSTVTSSTDIQYSREKVLNTMKRLQRPQPFPAMPGPDYVLNLSGTMGS